MINNQNLLKARAYDDGLSEEAPHRLVHQRVALDKVQRQVGQRARIIDALARPWIGHFRARYRQPIRIESALLLEVALERVLDILERERADRRAAYAVRWRRERAVDQLGGHTAVRARYKLRRRFCRGAGKEKSS